MSQGIRTCFISAPAGARLGTLRAALGARGIRVIVPEELTADSDWRGQTRSQLAHADLVIGVLTPERRSQWVLFELGQAWAFGRRIVLIAPAKSEPAPSPLQGVLVLRVDPENRQALDFALDQLLAAPPPADPSGQVKRPDRSGLGNKADELLAELHGALVSGDPAAVERITGAALRASGTDLVVEGPAPDRGADFAVWSDVLEPLVGNPLLIEVKSRVREPQEVRVALKQLATAAAAGSARWALLLYGEGPTGGDSAWTNVPPNVLVLSLASLFEALRTRPFPDVIRDLRNERVHGVTA